MFHQRNLNDLPASEPAPTAIPQLEASLATERPPAWTPRLEMPIDELAFRTRVAFRSHSHINNVLTHISRGNWEDVEQALRAVFDPATEPARLPDLARNILDLMCADRGVTGRIMKPFLRAFLRGLLEQELAEQKIQRLTALYLGVVRRAGEAREVTSSQTPDRVTGSQRVLDRDNRSEGVITVAEIDARYRHIVISQLIERLVPDQSLQLVVDHDPKPLRLQLEARHGVRCAWTYLETGPDVWRVRLRLLARGREAHPEASTSYYWRRCNMGEGKILSPESER